MRSILVLAGGRTADAAVFDTALMTAKALIAHLEFLHACLPPADAALYTPHVDFARGASLGNALRLLDSQAQARAIAARHHFETLCEKASLDIAVQPSKATFGKCCTSWSEERCEPVAGIVRFARHNDLVVVGRRGGLNGLPANLIERLLVESGRPILIAPRATPRSIGETVLVCWKESAQAARALTAAIPLLTIAKRVVLATIEEPGEETPEAIQHLAQRLEWDGIKVDARWLRASDAPVEDRLEKLAREEGADLVVMGGYGHSRLKEFVFSGCTRHFLQWPDQAVFMVH